MRRREFLRMTALGTAAPIPVPWTGRDALRFLQGTGPARPNFIFFLMDDLGWAASPHHGLDSGRRQPAIATAQDS